ncbi:uroporphyrinogen-III synthase [Pallidibacillus thermolactis]|jgi:uroporphyrinogen-III synthase|uniref:uroporphyrinogen-III synthase n=1 Tax=Pallidibacillus thermolactis TaxID=251051 RepID=UPI002E1F8D45|nr:uroporphyrinogen-III synthase [Pallidibacillus thermolactis]MED1674918.1 uroporphyrinogen-III synthase [Pallidibacillus thermolactis subsp. kokeshiiformis]
MTDLKGKTIGIAADRNATVFAKLIERNGGNPLIFSIQGNRVYNEEASKNDIAKLLEGTFDYVVLTTKIGVEYLEKVAKQEGKLQLFLEKLANTKLAVRGQKVLNWVKGRNFKVDLLSDDGSMDSLIKNLAEKSDGKEKTLFFQSFDVDDDVIITKFKQLGYEVYLSKPYYYEAADENTLQQLRSAILTNRLDAVLFTTKKQVKNLFQTENPTEQQALISTFNRHVLAVGIGKVTADSVERNHVKEVFYPDSENVSTMITLLGRYLTNWKKRIETGVEQ